MVVHSKINTRGVLVMWGILKARDAYYPLYLALEESMDHLLIHYNNHWRI
jgi:hypothetical protein